MSPADLHLPRQVRRVVDRLVRSFSPESISVFGSTAKGTADARSDVDLLVVAQVAGDLAVHRKHARQLATGCHPRVDVVLVTREELADPQADRADFLSSIQSTCVTVYRRESAR
jgi:predicted nucleotidyltransferase